MRNINPNPPLLNGANAAASQTSAKLDAQLICYASAQAVVSGGTSIVGTFQLQGSNDPCIFQNMAQDFTPTNWDNLGTATAISGNGAFMFAAIPVAYRWLRAIYTYTSGTGGTITINVNAISF